jgi:hypothetical protein
MVGSTQLSDFKTLNLATLSIPCVFDTFFTFLYCNVRNGCTLSAKEYKPILSTVFCHTVHFSLGGLSGSLCSLRYFPAILLGKTPLKKQQPATLFGKYK